MNVAILASGSGTNLQAILDTVHRGPEGVEVVAVAGNVPDARAFQRARAAGVPTRAFPEREHPDRAARDRAMAGWLAERGVELVVLAGYMQLLCPEFLARFPQRVINVHPALLPAFPGLNAVEQALAYGVRIFGVTVHFVDEGVDSGPIILQAAVEIPDAREPADVASVELDMYRANDIATDDTSSLRLRLRDGTTLVAALATTGDRRHEPYVLVRGTRGHLVYFYTLDLLQVFRAGAVLPVDDLGSDDLGRDPLDLLAVFLG